LFEQYQVYKNLTEIVLLTKTKAMSVIILLVFVSLAIAIFFLGAFIWSIRKNQYEDETGASVRILFEDKTDNTISKH
jgi:cbb3-type cytochrome oxidase maturation protein